MTAKLIRRYEDVARLWDERINTIPTVFGRMVYMAQQRQAYGRYSDSEIAKMTSQATCERVIRDAHVRAFRVWLALSLEEKTADLKPYFQTLTFTGPPHELRIRWDRLCRDLIPPRISSTEVNLFLGTAQTVLRFVNTRRLRPNL
jgi:hypothetical protein